MPYIALIMQVKIFSLDYCIIIIGKWHLSSQVGPNYSDAVNEVKRCGFAFADAVYHENMMDPNTATWHQGRSHNMEWITHEAIDFITSSVRKYSSIYAAPFFQFFD